MLQLTDYAIKNSIGGIKKRNEYWERIKFPPSNISNITSNTYAFTLQQIMEACAFTGASADWVLGLEQKMFRETKGTSALQLLHEAVKAVEVEMKTKIPPLRKVKGLNT